MGTSLLAIAVNIIIVPIVVFSLQIWRVGWKTWWQQKKEGGFNIFRRFRITHLQKAGCPEALQHFWSGHAPSHVSERYTKLREERDFRLDWAEKIGAGFELSNPVGQPGQLVVMRKSA